MAAIRKPKTFSVTSMRFSSSLSLTRFAHPARALARSTLAAITSSG